MMMSFESEDPGCETSGFTLIEVLVSVSIIGVILAILIPAVQSAREASRRGQCLNNLHQIGIALNSYESTHKVYPQGRTGSYSLHVMILPHLDQFVLYNSINFNAIGSTYSIDGPNSTAMTTGVSAFLCPSDVTEMVRGRTNYPGDTGFGVTAGPSLATREGMFTDGSDMRIIGVVGPAGVSDGTSQTVAVSEWNLGRYPVRDSKASVYRVTPSMADPVEFDSFVAACRDLTPGTASVGQVGKSASWFLGQVGETLFDHDIPPNGHSCLNGDSVNLGAWTAGSRHPGGVNVVFADGHVRFVRETIAPATWRSLGTRSGGEIVSDTSY